MDVHAQISGSKLGRYVVLERLGAGGMGVVYAAWDPDLDRRVAIKVIGDRDGRSSKLLQRRLQREAVAMAKLRHPNVVTVFDVGAANGQLFVAMEYVEGVSLRKWVRASSHSGSELLAVFLAAGAGLAAAHAQGIVHRDFKPDNVIVANDGRVLVLDFGLASWTSQGSDSDAPEIDLPERASDPDSEPPSDEQPSDEDNDDATLTLPGTVLGTPAYMAPEQRLGRPADARSDQFSFCAAMWEALTGKLPFGRSKRALARARVEKLAPFERRDIPASVERALRRGLSWHPEDRFPDINALLDALAPRPRRWPWMAVGGTLVVAALLSAFALGGGEAPVSVAPCIDGSERIEAIWNASAAEELGGVFEQHGPRAVAEWPYLRGELDRWTASWTAVDAELCRRYGPAGVPAQQLDCLDRQLVQLEATVDILATLTADELGRTTDLLASLPNPQRCREVGTGERARELPTVDPERRLELEQAIDRVALARQLSRLQEAERDSARLLTETKARGLEELHIRVARIRADTLVDLQRNAEGVDVALQGFAAAERSGEPRLRLRALLDVAAAYSGAQDPISAERWLALAETLAAELTLDRPMRAELAATAAHIAMTDSRFDEALVAWNHALAATDPETERFNYLDGLHHRAVVLFKSDRALEGLEQLHLCERLLGELVAPGHEKLMQLRLDIADAEETAGLHEQARVDYLEIAALYEQTYGGPTGYSIAARSHAAQLRDKLGDCPGGLAELEPLMPLGLEHMTYPSAILGNLIKRRVAICDYATPEAVEWGERNLKLYLEALGEFHPATATVLVDLAKAQRSAGQLGAALATIDRALAVYAKIEPDGKAPSKLHAHAHDVRRGLEAKLADADRE